MPGMCTQRWECCSGAGKTQMCSGFLSPGSPLPSSSQGRETEGHSPARRPEYSKAALSGFLGADSWHVPSAAPALKEAVVTCTPLYLEPHKPRAVLRVNALQSYVLH